MRTHLITQEWPEITRILDQECKPEPIPEELFPSLLEIIPFAEKNRDLWFDSHVMSTRLAEQTGASMDVEGIHPLGWYDIDMLKLLDGLFVQADFKFG